MIGIYKNAVMLDVNTHASLRLNQKPNFSFVKDQNTAPLVLPEFAMIAKGYPIVFLGKEAIAAVVLGAKEGENVFVGDDGSWRAGFYIPAEIRKYPFVGYEDQKAGQTLLCADMDAPHFIDGTIPLFEAGKPAQLTTDILNFIVSIQADAKATAEFSKALIDHNLLIEQQAQITEQDGKTTAINGFYIIDEKKFNELDSKTFTLFRKRGWLAPVYFHWQSLSNFGVLRS